MLGTFLTLLALACWALVIEPRRLVVTRVDLKLERWPAAAPPLRLALLSDLHVGSPYWGLDRLADLVTRTNAEHPDVIVLAGDYLINGVAFGSHVDPEAIAEQLGRLQAPLGVVAVLGNHDWWNDGPRVRRALESQHIVVLDNELATVHHHGTDITFVGLADQITQTPRPAACLDRAPIGSLVIAVVHEPDVFPSIDSRPLLTLAGHTHGGQVWLPIVGRLLVPSDYGQRYAVGHIVEQGRHLFVTSGVGTSIFPIRFGVPPEIALLTLRP